MATNSDQKSLDPREQESPASPYQLRQTLSRRDFAGISVAWSSDGNFVANGGNDGSVRIWEAQRGKKRHTLYGHHNSVWSIAWSPYGRWLASGSLDNTVRVWNAQNGQEMHTLAGHRYGVL